MIVRPVVYTQCLEEEFREEEPVDNETVQKLIQNTNLIRALLPIGQVKAYQINIPGVKIPPAYLYQLCDGGEITEPSSPLNGAGPQSVPDMQGRYVRGGSAATNSGNEAGGNATADLTHTHAIGNVASPFNKLEEGDEQLSGLDNHTHALTDDLSVRNLDPAHLEVAMYFKIG
jgi:hypothetical protein